VLVSVDGLDQRYLSQCDRLGLKIPNLRRLMREGSWAGGVIGEVPTITWPSHTTMLTGVPPAQHGIQKNQVWDYSSIKVKTLWDDLRAAGRTSAAITWPVTVGAPVTWNLPEYFEKRQGGSMDLAAVAAKATPGLVAEISARFPSFPQQWVDDRTRTLAALYLIREKHPDFLAVHLVDLDAEEHETQPFSQASLAILEYTDELIGQILAALPQGAAFALTSDHGFVSVERTVHPPIGKVTPFWVTTDDPQQANELEVLSRDPANGIGRRIPAEEWRRFLPGAPEPTAAYEPADQFLFSPAPMEGRYGKPYEIGTHGLWPGHPDYRSVFLLWGPGIAAARTPEMAMTAIYPRLKAILFDSAAASRRVVAIAHRGEHLSRPENTVPAFEEAIRLGADFIEVDVQTTSDAKLVLSHDATVDRCTNGHGRISEMTFDQVQALDAGVKASPEFAGTRIPTFDQVLELARGKIGIYVDVKNASARDLVAHIDGHGMTDRVVIYCGLNLARQIQELNPKLKVMPESNSVEHSKLLVEQLHPKVIAFGAKDFTPEIIAVAKQASALVYVDRMGATDGPDGWQSAIDAGADGIQTDRPGPLVEYLRRKGYR
jgi:glycerophosphoryl diester phosphodiesterase